MANGAIPLNPLYTPDPKGQKPIGADAVEAFLQAFLASQKESGANSRVATEQAGQNSRSQLQHEADMANVALRQKEYDLRIADAKTKAQHAKNVGTAIQKLVPIMESRGQGQQAVDALGPQVGLTPSGGQPQWTDQPQQPQMGGQGADVGGVLRGMDPADVQGVLDKMKEVQAVRTQQQRIAIGAKYKPLPDETLPQTISRLGKMSNEFASIGDHEAVAGLVADINALKPDKVDYDWFQDGKNVIMLPKEEGSRLRLGKPIAASGFGFGSVGPVGTLRAISAIAGMDNANDMMKPYEIKVATGQAVTTDKDYFQGQLSQLYNEQAKATGIAGYIVPFFGTAAGTQMLERLNKSNPDYANYLQAAAQWALEDAQLQPRGGSNFKTAMDEFISAVKPGAGVQSIHNLWKSRESRLAPLHRNVGALQAMLDRVTTMGTGTSIEPVPTPP